MRMLRVPSSGLTLVLGFVFLAASWPKLQFPYEFLSGVYSYELLGPEAGLYAAALLPWLEFIVGLCLVVGLFVEGALVIASTLCLLFVLVQCWALEKGLEISCSCFGSGGGMVSHASLLRTLVLFAVSLVALALYFREERTHMRTQPAGSDCLDVVESS